MQSRKEKKKANERGISLIIVLLVGMLMLLASVSLGAFAIRSIQSMNARSDATQSLYSAEQAFECVKYWLNQDTTHFSTIASGLGTPHVVECNGTSFDFDAGGADATYAVNGGKGVGTFRIPLDHTSPTGAGVLVEVERNSLTASYIFEGTIRVHSQSNSETSVKVSEKYQEYAYRIRYGADIMFVVDRSGSIVDNDDRVDRTLSTDWNEMLDAVNDSIRLLSNEVPKPRIGIVSFGTDANDTGEVADDNCASAGCNWRQPDQVLTEDIDELILDPSSTPANPDDDVPHMNLDIAATNLSLGISIAGAELMNKYYPHTGLLTAATGPAGEFSGEFERIVANNQSFGVLPDKDGANAMDRPDDDFPDVIVLITDGAPNAIMTHLYIPSVWYQSAIVEDPVGPPPYPFIFPMQYNYKIGEPKLFRSPTGGKGVLILDDATERVNTSIPLPGCANYTFCNDVYNFTNEPDNYFPSAPLNTNDYPHMAMCNATKIAEKLENGDGSTYRDDITFIAIYIGNDETREEAIWLRDHFVTWTLDTPSEPLFAMVQEYDEVEEAMLYLFTKLDFIQSR